MKKSYSGVMAEITRLRQQAEQLRKSEMNGVIKRIREAIQVYGLTVDDLGLGSAPPKSKTAPKASATPAARASGIGVPKFMDPQSGKTWTGRGKPPNWIVGVKDRSPYAIGAAAKAEK